MHVLCPNKKTGKPVLGTYSIFYNVCPPTQVEYISKSNTHIPTIPICLPMTFILPLQSLHHLPHLPVPVRPYTEQRSKEGAVYQGDCQPDPES